MKKLLSLLAVSTLGTVIGTTTGLSTLENVDTQINTFNSSSTLKTNIGDVLVNTNLGTINTKGLDQPTEQQIKNAIKNLIHQLKLMLLLFQISLIQLQKQQG